jgi:AAA15 family ATPase/GTPase
MLIEFSVTNFRSIRNKQTFSMVADASTDLQYTNILGTKLKGISLLPCAVIYGPNAAGKSNLIRAMGVMREIILNSADRGQESKPIKGIDPHALSKDEPTEFEVIFIHEDIRYQYGFSATKSHIVEEWLFAYPASRSQKWLERKANEWYINSDKVKGDRDLWKRATRNNALFLSTAAQLNSEQFKSIITWFSRNLRGGKSTNSSPVTTIKSCEDNSKKLEILNFLNKADFGISEIKITEKEFSLSDIPDDLPEEIRQKILKELQSDDESDKAPKTVSIRLAHATENGDYFSLDFSTESDGTHRIFELSGIWIEVLKNGYVIRIDELNDSLHPTLLRHLILLFHNKDINKNNAQLIFTTHDTTILDPDVLRRDQIWFIEKDKNQNSQLYPLSEFKPRKNEALQKNYLQGRYGALPYISHLFVS